jgi:hypothetical protein
LCTKLFGKWFAVELWCIGKDRINFASGSLNVFYRQTMLHDVVLPL